MSDQRIKGQEAELMLVVDGTPQATITDIRSFEIAPQFDLLQEGYIGEPSDRVDSVYRVTNGRMELHIENDDIFDLLQSVLDKAQRRLPGTRINLKVTLNFPNGDRPRIILQDVEFGPMPLGFASRADYGTMSLDFRAASYRRI